MAARFGLAFALAFLLLARPAQAQQYQRLHVRSFTLSSDTANPQPEQPFHVTLNIGVSDNLVQLRNVFLPTFFGAEELGDVRQLTHGKTGTTYRETLTLVAHERGVLSVSSAYLDAIDARDGKPKRFISNSLRLPVGGGPVNDAWDVLRKIALVAIDLLLLAALVFVVAALFWRRRRGEVVLRAAQVDEAEPEPIAAAPAKDEVSEAFDVLRERRDRACVLALRGALWRSTGASDGETLSDVLRRPGANDAKLRRLLMKVERAAFVEQTRLDDAIEEVLCNPRC
ncbi:MAG TPA: hypothetical protein VJP85_09585 [Candidatus Baltobacteraceae bacterium]|nr:hypothetical protein [Candidatus Baltobacteraceae bacterium]